MLLADRLLNRPDGLFSAGMTIRLIGVGVSRLSENQVHQMDLFEWADQNLLEENRKKEEERLAAAKEEEKRRAEAEEEERQQAKQAKLNEMMEKINSRYGSGTVKKGK